MLQSMIVKTEIELSSFNPNNKDIFCGAAPVAERLRALFLNHSIISPLCLVRVRAPLWPRETSQVLLVGVSGGFSGVLPFSPHLLIGPSHMS